MADFNHNSVDYNLSIKPIYPLEIIRNDDAVLKSPFEAGYKHTRPRFTKVPKEFVLKYKYLTDADKTTLENLFSATKFSDAFTWTNPQDSQSYTVRFKTIPKLEYILNGYWGTELELEEV